MIEIRYATLDDKKFWFTLDKHIKEREFEKKVRDNMAYIIFDDDTLLGLLRYSLFWDCIPFCNLLFIDDKYQKNGYGKMLINHWEKDMKSQGYDILLTSTLVNENAQHFYRKLGYKDCGGLLIDIPSYEQPMELFLIKEI